MAGPSELERLAVVENEVKNVRADVAEVKKILADGLAGVNKKLDTAASNFVDKSEASALEKRVTTLEKRNDLKNTLLWVGLVASAIINIVVIYQLFTGPK